MAAQFSSITAAKRRFQQQVGAIACAAIIGMIGVGPALGGALPDAMVDALPDALASPNQVLLMRHADAPGIGDPDGYVLGNCATQRNLGERGRRQARVTGQWLRAHGVPDAQVFSSPWCRALDTARLLGFGAVVTEPSLGSFFHDVADAGASTRQLEIFVARQLQSKGTAALILVTHQVNISAYAGTSLGSGDMVLAKVNAQGKVVAYRLYPSPAE